MCIRLDFPPEGNLTSPLNLPLFSIESLAVVLSITESEQVDHLQFLPVGHYMPANSMKDNGIRQVAKEWVDTRLVLLDFLDPQAKKTKEAIKETRH